MSADRYEITVDGPCVTIKEPCGFSGEYHRSEYADNVLYGAIRQQARDIAALKDALADEVTANEAFRKAGGARDDEDMPTFCARLIAERDAYRGQLFDCEFALKIEHDLSRERRADLAAAVAELGRLLDSDAYSRKELARGNEIIDGLRIERDTLRARLAAIDNAPTVAIAVHVYTDRGPYKYLNFAEHDIPASGVELIARPAKD